MEGDFSPKLSLSSLQLDMLRHPSYQSGKQDEDRRSPMTEEEAMESQHEMENAITYSTSIITNNHIDSDDKEDESLPQDLSMISTRNVDS